MKRAMLAAPVGDEQKREDPTVSALEERVAELLGKEAALFLPSGTMCNIIGLFVHCRPGDEVIMDSLSHPVYAENAGPAVHSRVSLRLIVTERGVFDRDAVIDAIRPERPQRQPTRLVAVENTNTRGGGSVWPVDLLDDVAAGARERGLATHLDGARLLNAVIATGVSAERLCQGYDSAWLDLSKGLGCPMGAVLAASEEFVEEARRAKHLFGGALRQAGVVAGAGLYALDHHVQRLREDHEHATLFANGLADIPGISVAAAAVETNIVHFDVSGTGLDPTNLLERARDKGVRFAIVEGALMRAVTHLGVSTNDISVALQALREACTS
jgi:threonine aldolase